VRLHRRLVPLALLFAAACGRAAPTTTAPTAGVAAGWRYAGQARVHEGDHAMVVSGSPIASDVGRKILEQGGNAVDAAVAVGFALAVVHPEAGNIGGGGFMVIRLADGTVTTIDYRETAPGRATRDMYLDENGNPTELSITGHLSAGVPGSPAGLVSAQRRYGKLPLAEVVQPAVDLARDGFEVD
jgi:gamma-glutamyltranspeptidase/glutathione hydrolase